MNIMYDNDWIISGKIVSMTLLYYTQLLNSPHRIMLYITMASYGGMTKAFKLLVNKLFVQGFVQANITVNIKALRYWSFAGTNGL